MSLRAWSDGTGSIFTEEIPEDELVEVTDSRYLGEWRGPGYDVTGWIDFEGWSELVAELAFERVDGVGVTEIERAWDVLGRAAGYGPTGPSSEEALDLLWRSAKRRSEQGSVRWAYRILRKEFRSRHEVAL